MSDGYIKIYRSLTKKGYYTDSEYVHLWVHLLMKATYCEKEYLFNDELHTLLPGQFITGRLKLSNDTGIEQSKVERILKCFENEHQIEQRSLRKFRIITICNWDEYQRGEQQNEQQINVNKTTSEQLVNTINKEKKEKKGKEYSADFISFYDCYPKKKARDDAWKAWQQRNGDRPSIEIILAAVEDQKVSPDWLKEGGKYVPLPASWIRAGRWADEVRTGRTGYYEKPKETWSFCPSCKREVLPQDIEGRVCIHCAPRKSLKEIQEMVGKIGG